MQSNQTMALFGIALAGLTTMDALAQLVLRTPTVPSRYFFRGLGVPATGPNPISEARSVTADGTFVLGISSPNNVSQATWTNFVASSRNGPRTNLPPLVTSIPAAYEIHATNTLSTITGAGGFAGAGVAGAVGSAAGPWVVVTSLIAPAFTELLPVDVNADGALIAANARVGTSTIFNAFVLHDGALINITPLVAAQTGLLANAQIADVADYRRVSVGVARDVNGLNDAFWFDHRTGVARRIQRPAGISQSLFIYSVKVSGDGLLTTTLAFDMLSPPPLGWFYSWVTYDNGATQTTNFMPNGFQAVWPDVVQGLNETGKTLVGMDNAVSEPSVWHDLTPQLLSTAIAGAGLSTPGFSRLAFLADISARNGVIAGHGIRSGTNLQEAFVAAIPEVRERSDFNRNGALLEQADITEWNARFAAGDLSADWNYDGQLTSADSVAFMNDWMSKQ